MSKIFTSESYGQLYMKGEKAFQLIYDEGNAKVYGYENPTLADLDCNLGGGESGGGKIVNVKRTVIIELIEE